MFKATKLDVQVNPNNFNMKGAITVGCAETSDKEQHMIIVITEEREAPPESGVAFSIKSVEDFADFMVYICNAASMIWGAENVCLHLPEETIQ